MLTSKEVLKFLTNCSKVCGLRPQKTCTLPSIELEIDALSTLFGVPLFSVDFTRINEI